MGFIKEFREFALRGNVIDLAVGVIIGGAFGSIVNSLIADVIMPVVGIGMRADFSNQFIALNEKSQKFVAEHPNATLAEARGAGAVLAYGSFITAVINFIILAFCIFLMVKAMNTLNRKKAEAPTPPAPSAQEKLLAEIRDLLRARA